jgi:Putative Flp pilus-assembly TadE/G-like
MNRKNQSGQALATMAIAMVVLAGFAGLAMDMGTLRYQKRLQQSAADAAAIAGASNIGFGGMVAGGQNAAIANGFTDASSNSLSTCTAQGAAIGTVCVQITPGPTVGPHAGNTNYVEAFVSVVQPTYFMTLFGVNSETVTARAVATNTSGAGGPGPGCLYTLGAPTASIEGVNINGNATLNAPTCGIVDNGNYNSKGNSLVVNASTFGVVGGANVSGPGGSVTCVQSPNSCPTPGMAPSPDPEFGKLTPPCSPCTGGTPISISGNGGFTGSGVSYANNTYTIQPGTYTSISISGTGGGNNVVFSPGLYIIDGTGAGAGITVPGNSTITGNGVTFYFTGTSTMNMTGNPTINLTAPDSTGTYPNILFYQDPADTSGPSLGGTSGSTYDGILYFPSAQVTFYGTSNSLNVAVTIADSIQLSGTPTVNLQGAVGLPAGPTVGLVTNAVLVE